MFQRSAAACCRRGPFITLASIAVLVLLCAAGGHASPAITSFTPAGGPPGTAVLLRGSGFGAVTGVRFNGIPASSWGIPSDTTITAFVPASAASGLITVTDGVATASSPSTFFVGQAPAISSMAPAGGPVGSLVAIHGNYFTGVTSVRFDGVPAAFVVNSITNISATVPAGVTTGYVSVTNPAGTGFSPSPFYLPPVIVGFAPAGGPVGTAVTLTGANLGVVAQVMFNGVSASFNIQAADRIVAYVPPGATAGVIRATSFAGAGESAQSFFVGAAPTVIGFTPAGGTPGTLVQLTGTSFEAVSGVTFGGVPALYSLTSATSLVATVPAGAITGQIVVTNPTGSGASGSAFHVGPAPVVSTVLPTVGPVGTLVTLQGSGFAGVTGVSFHGVSAANFAVNDDATMVATVPPGATTGPISVTNPAGVGVSSASFGLTPRVLLCSPAAVPASTATGTLVRVSGSNFSDAVDLRFGNASSAFIVDDDTHITTWVPAGAQSGPVTVSNLFGSGTSAVPFEIVRFTPPPQAGPGWPLAADVNLDIATGAATQQAPSIAADSTGGAFIVWQDDRSGGRRVYLQHVTRYGEIAPGWPANGSLVAEGEGLQQNPRVIADRVGGVFVAWEDGRSGSSWDIYAQRVRADGTRPNGWPAGGRVVSAAVNDQFSIALASDAPASMVIAWQDNRSGNSDVYVHHVLGSGELDPTWPSGGANAASFEGNQQQAPTIVSDESTGATYVGWMDNRGWQTPWCQRLDAQGAISTGWPADGIQLHYQSASEPPRLALDGAGGVYACWSNGWAQVVRLLSDGSRAPGWSYYGRAATNASSGQSGLQLLSDGQGGVFLTWSEPRQNSQDIAVQRLRSNGANAPGWPVNGLTVCAAVGEQVSPTLATDGLGGAFVTWIDQRFGDYDLLAARVMGSGVRATGWAAEGNPVTLAPGAQSATTVTWDGADGLVVAWQDARNGSYDIFAQNLGASGKPGNPEPRITSIRDLPADQGGHVRITWVRSPLDTVPALEISAYGVWRRVSAVAAKHALERGASRFRSGEEAMYARPGVFRATVANAEETWWEGVATVLARGAATYSTVAETFADSTETGVTWMTFMVDAHAGFGPYFWSSGPDSGFSVDNLAPTQPQALTATWTSGATTLHWRPNRETDLQFYRIHRSTDPEFVPTEVNRVATVADTLFVHGMGGEAVYKVVAVDLHGNTSVPAVVAPPSLVEVPRPTAPRELRLGSARPNPFREATVLRLELPARGHVRAAVFDASGRWVRTLLDGVLEAGVTDLRWDGRDTAGMEVTAGLYFARVEALGRAWTRRVARVR